MCHTVLCVYIVHMHTFNLHGYAADIRMCGQKYWEC